MLTPGIFCHFEYDVTESFIFTRFDNKFLTKLSLWTSSEWKAGKNCNHTKAIQQHVQHVYQWNRSRLWWRAIWNPCSWPEKRHCNQTQQGNERSDGCCRSGWWCLWRWPNSEWLEFEPITHNMLFYFLTLCIFECVFLILSKMHGRNCRTRWSGDSIQMWSGDNLDFNRWRGIFLHQINWRQQALQRHLSVAAH